MDLCGAMIVGFGSHVFFFFVDKRLKRLEANSILICVSLNLNRLKNRIVSAFFKQIGL